MIRVKILDNECLEGIIYASLAESPLKSVLWHNFRSGLLPPARFFNAVHDETVEVKPLPDPFQIGDIKRCRN